MLVTIYNINIGNNAELFNKSETLTQYETFVERVRGFESEHDLGNAIKQAISECVRRGILVEFLKLHGSDVMNMLTSEVNETKLHRYLLEDGIEIGREEGMAAERARIVSLIERGASLDDIKKTLSSEKPPRKSPNRKSEKK